MPYCSQCGNQVTESDQYCNRCGSAQPVAATFPSNFRPRHPRRHGEPFANVNARTASILCYIPWMGWIAAIIILASERFRNDKGVRFHAFQGLYLFVAWLIEDWVLRPAFRSIPHLHIAALVQALLLGASIFMIVKTSHGESYSLPIIGEMAERSVNE